MAAQKECFKSLSISMVGPSFPRSFAVEIILKSIRQQLLVRLVGLG